MFVGIFGLNRYGRERKKRCSLKPNKRKVIEMEKKPMQTRMMLEGMITEEELMSILGISKPEELEHLRNERHMPYVRLNSRRRVYLERDIMAWFDRNRENIPEEPKKG